MRICLYEEGNKFRSVYGVTKFQRELAGLEVTKMSGQYKDNLSRWRKKRALQNWTVGDVCEEVGHLPVVSA